MRRAAVALLFCLCSAGAQAKTVSYALVIGNNAPPSGEALTSLRYADDDAVRFHQLFSRIGADVRLLSVLDQDTQRRYPGAAALTRPPTLANVALVVKDFAARMERDHARGDDPVFYLVFSGHGVWNGREPPMLSLLDGGLTQAFLYEQILAKVPATYTHLFVDACHAGAVVGVRGESFGKELDARTEPVAAADARALVDGVSLSRFPSVGVLIATSADQEAHEWSQFESGVFSHELISGLLGAADANGDEQIEYSEAQAFVAAANRQVGDPRAVPRVIALPPRSNLNVPLISLKALRGATLLHGELASLGPFHVELEDGQRLLDAHFASDSQASVAIPTGQRAFIVRQEAEAELGVSRDGELDVRALRFHRRREHPRGSVDADYRVGRFAAAYGASYYRGFVDSTGASLVRFDEARRMDRGDPLRLRRPAIALFALGGATTAGSIVAGVLMLQAKQDFNGTMFQRAAHDADERYTRALVASVANGVIAVGSGVAGLVTWLRSRSRSGPE